MDKKKLEVFIRKYNLGGNIEGVIWTNENGDLATTAMTSDKKLFASVVLEKGASFFPAGTDIGIQDTTKLKKMLNSVGDNVTLSLDVDENDATRVRLLKADDGNNTMKFVTAQKDVLNAIPKMKNIPSYTVEILLTPKFAESFSKSYSAIGDPNTLFTLVMSKKKQKLEVVLGYKQQLSDCIEIGVETTTGKDTVKDPISFSANALKEILAANSEVEDATLSVSESGLASVSFKKDDFKSQYYLVKIEVED